MPNGHGFSFPYGFPLVTYPLLAIGIANSFWWSVSCTVLALLCTATFTWEALSRQEYMKIYEKDPTLNRLTWVINWLLFFAIPPAVLSVFGVGRWVLHWLA